MRRKPGIGLVLEAVAEGELEVGGEGGEDEAVKSLAFSAVRRRCQLGGSKDGIESKVWRARL